MRALSVLSGLAAGAASGSSLPAPKIAVVTPFFPGDAALVAPHLDQRWALSCPEGSRSSQLVDLVLYNSRNEYALARQVVANITERIRSCFNEIRLVNAGLTEEQDRYPMGPGHQFYRIFLNSSIADQFERYAAFAIVERDVRITRPGALEELYDAAIGPSGRPEFWVKGGSLAGVEFHETVRDVSNWDMLGHINGNALYTLSDPRFKEYVNYTQTLHPPVETSYPFDVALWATLTHFPYSWPLWQRFVHHFQHTDLFTNLGLVMDGDVTGTTSAFVHSSGNSYFIGGQGDVDAGAESKVEQILCPNDCQGDAAGAAPATCDATCSPAAPGGQRWGGYGCETRGEDVCRRCYTDLDEALAADKVAQASGARVIMCDTRMPPVHPQCHHQCGSYSTAADGTLTLLHGSRDTVCDMTCSNSTVGHGCGAAGLGEHCRFCFQTEEDARRASLGAVAPAVLCSSLQPPPQQLHSSLPAVARRLDNSHRRLVNLRKTCEMSKCERRKKNRGRVCDPGCLSDPQTYGGYGCGIVRQPACRRCYTNISRARRFIKKTGTLVIMCDTLKPPHIYGQRRRLVGEEGVDSEEDDALLEGSDADEPQPQQADVCVFTRVFPGLMDLANIAAKSAREHLPRSRVVLAVPVSQYDSALANLDPKLAADADVRLVPVADDKHKYSELWADELCGGDVRKIYYQPIGAVMTRQPEYLDMHRPSGELLVSHMSYDELPPEALVWRHQNLALLGWPTPCFTHGQDVVLPASIPHDLRATLSATFGDFAPTLEQFGNAFNAVELLAGFAYGAQPAGVAFQDTKEWSRVHTSQDIESIFEIPLIKPPFSCRGDIASHSRLAEELRHVAHNPQLCPHGFVSLEE